MGRRVKQVLFRNQTWGKGRMMYRIQKGEAYSGCIPITVWFVQVRRETRFGYEWINIKGYDKRERAEELLNILKTNKLKGLNYEI